jgi:D-tyrosyl-tRNA(Tyr) deacylase
VRAVVQRVRSASVVVDGDTIGAIGSGLLVFVGVAAGDGPADVAYVSSKVRDLRVFPDETGRMNRSVGEVGGAVLVVSQFTLLGDVRKGRRPAFDAAEGPERARQTYEALVETLRSTGLTVEAGRFQAHMLVSLENEGPVTILIDSRRSF